MKIKLLIMFCMVFFSVSLANAWVSVVMRGNASQKCQYVKYGSTGIICLGVGNTICPSKWGAVNYRGINLKGEEIISYVTRQIEQGEQTGTGEINEVSFKWQAYDDGFEINIDTDKIVYEENEK